MFQLNFHFNVFNFNYFNVFSTLLKDIHLAIITTSVGYVSKAELACGGC